MKDMQQCGTTWETLEHPPTCPACSSLSEPAGYVPGMGCKCAAHNEDECACPGVDWAPRDTYILREVLDCLHANMMRCTLTTENDKQFEWIRKWRAGRSVRTHQRQDGARSLDRLVGLLMVSAFNLWRTSCCAGPPIITTLFNELENPKEGDLVMEISAYRRTSTNVKQGIGELVSITQEPIFTPEDWKASGAEEGKKIPTETVYTIKLIYDDGSERRWSNAKFIKVKTD